jgi:hypothetical protein
MPARLSFPIHDMSGGEASSMVWAFFVQMDYFRVARDPRGIWLPTLDAFKILAS